MHTIVNLYIEVPEGKDLELEFLLRQNGYAFYDASLSDPYTKSGKFATIEEIEADIECK